MVNAYYGVGTGPTLVQLQHRGLVRSMSHMPEEGVHWELTPSGRIEAERILKN
jgi:manganese/zinc/iron transport system permease protein